MDFEVRRCTRHCAETHRQLEPGEIFYALLRAEGADVVRYDYSVQAWPGPPDDALGWWKSQVPERDAKRIHWAPNDVMLELFEKLEGEAARQGFRFVLALLLVRRRVLRLEDPERDEAGREQMVVYCPRRDATYHVPSTSPTEEQTEAIQEELVRLLIADAA